MAYNLISQKFRILILQSQTIVFLILIPVLQLNYHVNILSILHAFYTKQRFYINNANSSQLNKMLGNIRRASHQSLIADLADLHNIICNQAVSTLNQLQGSLTFSNTALAHNQNALTKYVYQYAVNADAGRHLYLQPANHLCHQIRCALVGNHTRNLIVKTEILHIFIRHLGAAVEHTGNFTG